MRNYLITLCIVAVGFMCVGLASANQAEEAKTFVKKAVSMAQKEGLDKTFKAISNRKGPFVKGQMYVFAGDFEKTTLLAHPFAPEMMIGSNMKDFKDRKGTPVFVEFAKILKDSGEGWLEYLGRDRITSKDQPKKAYVMRVPGTTIFMGCAYYLK